MEKAFYKTFITPIPIWGLFWNKEKIKNYYNKLLDKNLKKYDVS